MEIVSCLNPQTVWNVSLNRYILVPCGRCKACRCAHGLNWSTRVQDECSCWRFSIFLTLTYSDDFIPVVHYDKDTRSLIDLETGECWSLSDLVMNEEAALKYLRKRRWKINVCRVRDFQLFMKRFRFNISQLDSNETKESKRVRYFCAFEYGPTTHRAHMHCILWFNSQTIFANLQSLLSASWKCGFYDFSPVKSSAPQYVARYLNCFDSLPEILKCSAFRPKHLFSKCPPIGSMFFNAEAIREIFDRGFVTYNRPNGDKSKFIDVPLPRYIKDRLFPKITGFSKFSHLDRVALYGVAKWSNCETFSEFERWYTSQLESYTYKDIWASRRISTNLITNIENICRDFDNSFTSIDSYTRRLNQLFRISRRVCLQCEIFHVSLDEYVRRIDNFYSHVSLYNLRKQYEFEEEFVRSYPLSHLVNIDPSFVDIALKEYSNLLSTPLWITYALESFGLSEDFLRHPDMYGLLGLEFNPSYGKFAQMVNSIINDSTKNRVKKEYLRLHPELRI